jgi:UDP-2-acetamido-3-amino-2,3-dideoxy-glucuronate N-acetyltransferase
LIGPAGWGAGCYIHPQALVHSDTEIGSGTYIWQFASIIRGAKIGRDCSIASCAIVDGSRLGDRCIVSHGAFIDPGVEIGDEVFIGPNVTLCNDAWPRVEKSGFDISALLSGEFVTTRIERGASLGAGVVVLPGVVIGARAMIAAGATVTADVPAGNLYKRDGTMCVIDEAKIKRRMREAA